MKILRFQLFVLVCTILIPYKAFNQQDFKLYNNARKLTYEKKWDNAIESYDRIRKNYPDSRYRDDADFWTAYILEKKGKTLDAFMSYQQLIKNYPNSPWVDDALIHQMLIAEMLVRQGQVNYIEFLNEKLDHKDKNVRYQSALSLGKLRYKNALPVLNEIVANDDEDLSAIAKSLIEDIDKGSLDAKIEEKGKVPSDIDILLQAKKQGGLSDKKERGFWDKLFIETDRYKTYKKLNKKGENWMEMELITYGLWHILPEEQFNGFFSLSDDYDKKEWLRKFWIKWDPTPTTPENERKEEFIRRVHYARSHFGDEWNFRHAKYLTDQYLRTGWSVAPWDCRGELYIKYGEPDFRDTSKAFEEEIWTYYRYNVDFVVKPYITNIFGNAINPGPISRFMYKWDSSRIDAEYIFKPDFKFDVYHDFEPLKNFKFNLDIKEIEPHKKAIAVSYTLSGREFKFNLSNGQYKAQYHQGYVIYDEDLKEVVSNQKKIELVAKSDSDTRKNDNFKIDIDIPISPGYYTLALRIKDLNSKKLGIFLKEFNVK